eukprot:gene25726-biopygen24010
MQRRRRCQEQEHANPPHSVMFCPVLSCPVLLKGKVKSEKRRRRRANGNGQTSCKQALRDSLHCAPAPSQGCKILPVGNGFFLFPGRTKNT